MAHIATNAGLEYMASNDMGAADIRLAVFVGAAPTAATVRDYNFLSQLTGAQTEAAVAEYVRQDLTGVTVTKNDGPDNVTITADDATINSVSAGETWSTVAYYIFNASDAAATLLSVDELAAAVPTNGGNITLPGPSYTIAQA